MLSSRFAKFCSFRLSVFFTPNLYVKFRFKKKKEKGKGKKKCRL